MFLAYLKFAFRVFLKDKFFSTLNILGLALGIAVSIILLLILQNDLTYDEYHINHKRIYRLGAHLIETGVEERVARSARELGEILKAELPEVEEVVRANDWDHALVRYVPKVGEPKAFYENDIVRTDSTYFDVFTHEFVAGNPKKCLASLNTLVLSESKAKKYFGADDAMGKILEIAGASWTVTGVIRDVPENTHLKFDILLSHLTDRDRYKGDLNSDAFWNPDVYTYLLVPENYNTADFYAKFPKIYNKYFKSYGDKINGKYEPTLEPLTDIHFHSNLSADEPHGNLSYLYSFTAIGAFIILLACINYMNLSTAKSMTRASEIAMKKVLGSTRFSMVFSFLFESIFLSIVSLFLAASVVTLLLKTTSFNELIGKNLSPDFIHNQTLLVGSIGIALGIGILSGLYPAFYLPRVPVTLAIKGAFKSKKSSAILRKALMTGQFAISMFVVVCTLFMQDQINYIRNKELGFDKQNMLVVPIQDTDTPAQQQLEVLKHEFSQNPHILAITTSYDVMGMNVERSFMWTVMAEGDNGMQQHAFNIIWAGDNYLETMGIKLINGRNFQSGPNADIGDAFIVNEAAAKLMGWSKDPIGKKINFVHAEKPGHVIGVVKDFNFVSLHNPIEPLLIVRPDEEGGYIYLKIKGDLGETIKFIKDKWASFDPNNPFEYFFLDQRFSDQYKTDEIQYKLLSGLSYICIFISLLGLLGLSAFTATRRTKEIGIRNVHGATIPSIIYLLYKEIMLLIITASVLIIPITYYVVSRWLTNFAYQIELNYFIFLVVAVLALLIALLTVGFHSFKVAKASQITSLKYE